MPRAPRVLAAIVAIVAVLGAWYWRAGDRPDGDDQGVVVPVPSRVENPIETAHAGSSGNAVTTLKFDTGQPDYAAGYRDADDLLAFLKSIAPAAQAGDPDALYWTFRASRRCVRDYIVYFGHGDHERTLEGALAMNAQFGPDEKSTRELYARCASFKAAADNPYRDWKASLKRAADGGSPVGQAAFANEKRLELVGAQDPTSKARLEDEMLTLARQALRSKDPAVLIELSGVAATRVKPTDVDANGGSWQVDDMDSVWIIAACQRGYDCSLDNEDFRYVCHLDFACQPFDTILDFLRRRRPDNFDELQLRASDLNAKLDANRFDEIDL
jgi:hypothetical protein